MDDPVNEPINECWSCGEVFRDGDGVSIHGTGDEVVCRSCWSKVPVWRRLWLGLWFRNAADGGVGARELFGVSLKSFWLPRPGNN
jgi:hypothetical protein